MTEPDRLFSRPGPLRRRLARWLRTPGWADLWQFVAMALVMGLAALAVLLLPDTAHALPLSAGDRVQLVVEAGEEISGKYQVDVGGRLTLPYAGAVPVGGLEPEAAAAAVSDRLVAAGLFRRDFVRSTLQVLAWAPLEVRVSGAVNYPGPHQVNRPLPRDRAPDKADDLPGGGLPERRLSDALRAAGGVTPWADVAHIALRRQGQTRLHDLWPLMRGEPGEDPPLQAGDEILVPLLDAPQGDLARPSAITPPGIKVFVSNLVQPATGNAAAGVGGGTLSLAYGSRLSQAVVAGNCVGGIAGAGGARSAVLVRTDRRTGTTRHWDSPVEALVREGSDETNPVLLEGDAVACYDAAVTGMRDIFRTIADIVLPFSLWRGLR